MAYRARCLIVQHLPMAISWRFQSSALRRYDLHRRFHNGSNESSDINLWYLISLWFTRMPRGRRHSRREIRPTASMPSRIAWSRQWDRAAAIRRASLIKINYVCRVIVRLIESRDSAGPAAKSFRPRRRRKMERRCRRRNWHFARTRFSFRVLDFSPYRRRCCFIPV